MSTQHTPGDWDICWDGKRYVIHDNTALQRHIAYTSDGGVPDDEAWANACLIAAAPELLEALRVMVAEGRHVHAALAQMGWSANAFSEAAERADAAIAKATTP
jgi:hypothetical protein